MDKLLVIGLAISSLVIVGSAGTMIYGQNMNMMSGMGMMNGNSMMGNDMAMMDEEDCDMHDAHTQEECEKLYGEMTDEECVEMHADIIGHMDEDHMDMGHMHDDHDDEITGNEYSDDCSMMHDHE